MLRERAINWHVFERRGETLEIGSLFEGRQSEEREREEERYVCIKDTSSTPSCLARVISLLEAKWGKLKAPYRRPLPVLLACWLPVSGCGTTGLENRVDGARSFERSFVYQSSDQSLLHTIISRHIFHLDYFHSWKSYVSRRSKREGERVIVQENDKFLIFIIDEARFVKFIRVGGKS